MGRAAKLKQQRKELHQAELEQFMVRVSASPVYPQHLLSPLASALPAEMRR